MLGSQILKIALGDLRHETVGRHSVLMPIGIAYIASYMLSKVDSNYVEVRLYDRPGEILRDIEQWKPSIIGLSNYCWNAELSRVVFNYAKKLNPDTICVSGGPEFPIDRMECKEYLLYRKEIDFYVYLEGEVVFADLVKKLQRGVGVFELKSKPQDGIMSIHPYTSELVAGEPAPRLENLDEIPSPYLSGLLERWFDGYYAPSMEITRGCPFSCGYCHTGHPSYNMVARFSVERVKAELTYIAQQMAAYPNVFLSIYDANFGMFEHDEEIAKHMGGLQDEFGWPSDFDVTTGKANYDRILRIVSHLKNKMQVTCSVQSLNPKTLQVIKRKNLPLDEYEKLQSEIKRRGIRSVAELITPMPEETKSSFFKGVKDIVSAGAETVVPYTTMLLKGTYLGSQECCKKYAMQTKFRLIPRQFGEYVGQKCFEVEEVCVATNTMSFKDYFDCRGFALISGLLSSEQFDVVRRHLKELDVSYYDWFYFIWETVRSGKSELSGIYNEYIQETQEELWPSKEALYEYFSKQEAYEKLLKGDLGDNLIRKYKAKVLLECCAPAIEMAYYGVEKVAADKMTRDVESSLNAAKQWMVSVRDIGVLRDKELVNNSKILSLLYDVNGWYTAGGGSRPLSSYRRPVNYRVYCDTDELTEFLNEAKRLFGKDLSYRVGKLLVNWSISKLWRKCEPVTKEAAEC